jgi:hypothetical protein
MTQKDETESAGCLRKGALRAQMVVDTLGGSQELANQVASSRPLFDG